jgi:hypothetical protein
MADAPVMPRLTPEERRVLHCIGFVAACRIHDERLDLVVDQLRRALALMAPKPHTESLAVAGKSICAAFKRRTMSGGSMDWLAAHIDASRVSQHFHWAALCSLDGV